MRLQSETRLQSYTSPIRWMLVQNVDTQPAPAYAVLGVQDVVAASDGVTPVITVARPDGKPAQPLLINGTTPIAPNAYGQAHATYPAPVLYDPGTGLDPENEDTLGPQPGEWSLGSKGGKFAVLGGAGGGLVNVDRSFLPSFSGCMLSQVPGTPNCIAGSPNLLSWNWRIYDTDGYLPDVQCPWSGITLPFPGVYLIECQVVWVYTAIAVPATVNIGYQVSIDTFPVFVLQQDTISGSGTLYQRFSATVLNPTNGALTIGLTANSSDFSGRICMYSLGSPYNPSYVSATYLGSPPMSLLSCSGGSGSGSGSGGGGDISTLCCPDGLPPTLHATISNVSGCACMAGTYAIVWNGSTAWTYSGTVCGVSMSIVLSCDNPGSGWAWGIDLSGCNGGTGHATSFDCSVPQIVFSLIDISGCCSGAISITIGT